MAVRVLGDNVKIQKIYTLHQIINKYMNKVPIFSYFLCKIPIFFPIFWHREFLFSHFLTIPIT